MVLQDSITLDGDIMLKEIGLLIVQCHMVDLLKIECLTIQYEQFGQ